MDKQELEDYLIMEKQIHALQKRINHLKELEAQYEYCSVRGSNPVFPFQPMSFHIAGYNIAADEKKRMRIRYLEVKLDKQMKEAEEKRLEVEEFVSNISDRTVQLAFTYVYLEGMTQEEAGRKIGLDRTSVSKKIDKYLQLSHNSHF